MLARDRVGDDGQTVCGVTGETSAALATGIAFATGSTIDVGIDDEVIDLGTKPFDGNLDKRAPTVGKQGLIDSRGGGRSGHGLHPRGPATGKHHAERASGIHPPM